MATNPNINVNINMNDPNVGMRHIGVGIKGQNNNNNLGGIRLTDMDSFDLCLLFESLRYKIRFWIT